MITSVSRTFGGDVQGTLVRMVLIGILSGIGLAILQVPSALLLGVLAGFTELIPYLGPWISRVSRWCSRSLRPRKSDRGHHPIHLDF